MGDSLYLFNTSTLNSLYGEIGGSTLPTPSSIPSTAVSNGHMNSTQASYINQIIEAAGNIDNKYAINGNDMPTALNETIEEIKEIESEVLDVVNTEDAKMILAAASVARYSLHYWTVEFENGGFGDCSECLPSVAESDIYGAAAGAARYYAVAIFTGPYGYGVYAGAVVGSAVYASAFTYLASH